MRNDYLKEKKFRDFDKDKISNYATSAVKEGQEQVKNITENAQKQPKEGQEEIGHFIGALDKQVRENPWPVIAGVALGSLLLGTLISKSK